MVTKLSYLLILSFPAAFAGSLVDNPATSGPNLLDQRRPTKAAQPHAKSSIRIDVAMTLVPVTVVDPYGRTITGLTQQNFKLFEERQRREIASFSMQDAPVSVGIVFDSSGSMRDKLQFARQAVSQFMKRLNPEDEAFLVTVADRPELRYGFTRSEGEITSHVLFSHAKGQTALIDGVYMALSQLHKAHNSRKALIVVSDGGDNNSRYTLNELMAFAMETDAQIYTIGICQNPASQEESDGPELLEQLSVKTGGRPTQIQAADELGGALTEAANALHNQYVLGYYPPNGTPAGKFRRIRVELEVPGTSHSNLKIYARRGYYTPE